MTDCRKLMVPSRSADGDLVVRRQHFERIESDACWWRARDGQRIEDEPDRGFRVGANLRERAIESGRIRADARFAGDRAILRRDEQELTARFRDDRSHIVNRQRIRYRELVQLTADRIDRITAQAVVVAAGVK